MSNSVLAVFSIFHSLILLSLSISDSSQNHGAQNQHTNVMQSVESEAIEYLEEDLETIELVLGPDINVGTSHETREYTETVNQFYAIEKYVFNPNFFNHPLL